MIKLYKNFLFNFFILSLLSVALPLSASAGDNGKFVVVIDAGHGGSDVGAVDNGYQEKDINLGVALKLGDMIKKKLKNTEVVYTRDDDTFLSLQKRADIANKAKGDLFISIHTNSVDKSNKNRTSVSGASTYVLGLHRDESNLAVAQRENSVILLENDKNAIYKDFDPAKDESYIVFEMAQKKNLANSIKFAGEVQKEMSFAGRNSRGVHQAGFWVLWSTAMPSVLIELDFICNPEEAKFLSSKEGQNKLAGAIFNAVKSYEEYYRSSLKKHAQYGESPADEEQDIPSVESTRSAVMAASDKNSLIPTENDMAVLEATESEKERHHLAQETRSTATPRRRRSVKSKEASEQLGVENANIILVAEAGFNSPASIQSAAASEFMNSQERKEEQPAAKDISAKKDDSKKTSKRTYQNKEVTVAQVTPSGRVGMPARRSGPSGSYRAKKQTLSTVYKILILESSEPITSSSAEFKGLKPVSSFRENNIYKYTYGQSKEIKEMETLLQSIQDRFPEASIIKCISD